MAEQGQSEARVVNPYLLPQSEQGWRGMGLAGNRHRKWFTLVQNEQVLVTGLILLPGEGSVRHSHETGELSIAYNDAMRPVVTWHPGGELHSGAPDPAPAVQQPNLEQLTEITGNGALAEVIAGMMDQQRELKQAIEEMRKRELSPRIIIDVLFPPFRTTIQDDGYPEARTITGQWYD